MDVYGLDCLYSSVVRSNTFSVLQNQNMSTLSLGRLPFSYVGRRTCHLPADTHCILQIAQLCMTWVLVSWQCAYFLHVKTSWWSSSWTAWSPARRSLSGELSSWTASSPVCWWTWAFLTEVAHVMTPRFISGSVARILLQKCQINYEYKFPSEGKLNVLQMLAAAWE